MINCSAASEQHVLNDVIIERLYDTILMRTFEGEDNLSNP